VRPPTDGESSPDEGFVLVYLWILQDYFAPGKANVCGMRADFGSEIRAGDRRMFYAILWRIGAGSDSG
jgi:hypothetical protein